MSLVAMGRDLRSRRRAAGLTQAGLAEAVGTRPVMVGRWERGEAVPSMDEAIRLAEILDLDPAVAAGWSAVALRTAPDPGGPPSAAGAAPGPLSPTRRPGWAPRLSGLAALLRARAGATRAAGAAGLRPPGESYLDDPVEQRHYALRWALTLLALGALAIGLIWALGELQEGWSAFLDLFRGGPPGTTSTRALPWLLVG
ncbi:MAG: helix-turn-helix protein [Actinobacteria bacterium]|nr:helix-turn-helix protein [Acidobacteriota bacterium]MBS1195678.1 helix-turn-helix protein [Actinomycetota bacterium]